MITTNYLEFFLHFFSVQHRSVIHTDLKPGVSRLVVLVCFCFIHPVVTAQNPGEWMWVGGSDVDLAPTNYGIRGVTSPDNYPPGIYAAATWTDLNGNFWLFGGVTTDYLSNVMWKLDPVTLQWTWITGSAGDSYALPVFGTPGVPAPENTPGTTGFGMSNWVDEDGLLWLFGGYGNLPDEGMSRLNYLWNFNPETYEWTFVSGLSEEEFPGSFDSQGEPSPTAIPEAISESKCDWRTGNEIWTYGGERPTGYSDNLWRYNIDTGLWSWMKGSGATLQVEPVWGTQGVEDPANTPGGRSVFISYQSGNDLYMMGGQTGFFGYPNDVWRYNTLTNQWTWVAGTGGVNDPNSCVAYCDSTTLNGPGSLYETRSFWTGDCGLWFFGGVSLIGDYYNNLWYYDYEEKKFFWVTGNNETWTPGNYGQMNVSAPTNSPPAKAGASSFKMSDGRLLLFGGYSINAEGWLYNSNDMWIYKIDPDCVYACDAPTPVTADFQVESNVGCAPFLVQFQNTSTNATSYLWDFGDGTTSTAEDPSHVYEDPGTYEVMLTAYGESASDIATLNLIVGSPAQASFIFDITNSCAPFGVDFINTSTHADSYIWTIDALLATDSVSVSHEFEAGEYEITLIANNNKGCPDTATTSLMLVDCEGIYLFIPNVFTPDGDHFNDTFEILNSGMKEYELTIFNRWGNKLFTSTSSAKHWDGKAQDSGNLCSDGTYYYILKVRDIEDVRSTYSGYLTLLGNP